MGLEDGKRVKRKESLTVDVILGEKLLESQDVLIGIKKVWCLLLLLEVDALVLLRALEWCASLEGCGLGGLDGGLGRGLGLCLLI